VLAGPPIALCRNYDYSPDLWERVVYSSAFRGRPVIGNNDCLWGLLDGMNADGLVVSLSFGGRRGSGPGFAVSLVVRYLLEVASTVFEAIEILKRLPVAMTYNLTMVDAAGTVVTAYVGPGRTAEFSNSPIATNHRGELPDDDDHAHRYASVQRRTHLLAVVADDPTPEQLVEQFLQPPLHSPHYRRAFGTVYTALYRPADGVLELCWPDRRWGRRFDDPDDTVDIVLRPR
jgi:predicted choloylglycine hydrolase